MSAFDIQSMADVTPDLADENTEDMSSQPKQESRTA